MGLGQSLPSHLLVPEAVIIKLDKAYPKRLRIQDFLAKTICWELMLAIRKNKLDGFYKSLLTEIAGNEQVTRQMSVQQQHVSIDRHLRNWLVEVETAISYIQHNNDSPKIFRFIVEGEQVELSLRQVSRLRTFLYRELELPLHGPQTHKPSFEGVE